MFCMIQILFDNPVPVLLVFFGVWFIVGETMLPSFGALGISGGLSFGIGAMMLIFGGTTELNTGAWLAFGVAILTLGFMIVLLSLVVQARRHRVSTGAEALRHSTAQVVSWDGAAGEVQAAGTVWKAISSNRNAIKRGDTVKIAGVDGVSLYVIPVEG